MYINPVFSFLAQDLVLNPRSGVRRSRSRIQQRPHLDVSSRRTDIPEDELYQGL